MEQSNRNDIFSNSHIKAAVYITDQGHYLFQCKEGEGSSLKTLREADVRTAFSRKGTDSGWLQPGVIRAGFSTRGPWYVYYHEPMVRSISIIGIGKVMVPVPALLMVGQEKQIEIFAVKRLEFKDPGKTLLWHAPFPNVYDDGRICWGKNKIPAVDASKAEKIYDLFFTSPFNADLKGGKSIKYKEDVRLMLQEVDFKGEYPLKDLVRYRGYQTGTLEQRLSRVIIDDGEEDIDVEDDEEEGE